MTFNGIALKKTKVNRDMYLKIIKFIAILGCVQSSLLKGRNDDTLYNNQDARLTRTEHYIRGSNFKRFHDLSNNVYESNDEQDAYVDDLMSTRPEDYSSKSYSAVRYVRLPKESSADVSTYRKLLAAKHDASHARFDKEEERKTRDEESYLHKDLVDKQLAMLENDKEGNIPGRYGDDRYDLKRDPKEIPGRYGDKTKSTKRIPGRYGDNRNFGSKKNLNLNFKDTFSIPGRYGDEKKAEIKISERYSNRDNEITNQGIPGRYGDVRYFATIPGRYGDRKVYRSVLKKRFQQNKRDKSERYTSKNANRMQDNNVITRSKHI